MKTKNKTLIILFLLIGQLSANAQEFGLKGQAIGWLGINPEKPFMAITGARYIPTLTLEKSEEEKFKIDGEFSLNSYVSGAYIHDVDETYDYNLKPYRAWVRYSTPQLEVRAGLQKINFGTASMLRPLMWFDKMDPRDPLQLTDGVYGLLGRYYFLNNANVWLWGLLGNNQRKGWEYFASEKWIPEFGGRIQIPFFTGEIATTYHHRKLEPHSFAIEPDTFSLSDVQENRYAIDFKLDKVIGFWFEGALTHQPEGLMKYKKALNIGADYTFGIGNGLGLTTEFFAYHQSNELLEKGQGIALLANSLTYPLTIISNINAFVYYDFTNEDLYRFINVSWAFDRWSFFAMAFWNPDKYQIYQNIDGQNIFTGRGFQLMAVFNH